MPISGFDFGSVDDMGQEALSLQAVIPPTGPVEGGTRVRFRGGGLTDRATVLMGGQPVDLQEDAGGLTATTPPADLAGPVDVKVIAPDGRAVILEEGYTYTATVALAEVTPRRVPTRGGCSWRCAGRASSPRPRSVSRAPARSPSSTSRPSCCSCSPRRAPGAADVRVTTPGGDALLEDAVDYFEPLALARLAPASGLPAGGESVVLYGRGFDPSVSVSFDGQPAPVVARWTSRPARSRS